MTSRDFCYWLQGYFEIDEEGESPTKTALNIMQVDVVKRHLAMVFKHEIDSGFGDKGHVEKLSEIHSQKYPWTPGPLGPQINC